MFRRIWLNLVARWRLSCWLYVYPTDDDVDLFLWQASQSDLTILRVEPHNLFFEFNGLGVRIWNSNKWHGWASDGTVNDGKNTLMWWDRKSPSPHVIWHLKEALNRSIGKTARKPSVSDFLYKAAVESDDG